MKHLKFEKWSDSCFAFLSNSRKNIDGEFLILCIIRFSTHDWHVEYPNKADSFEHAEVSKKVKEHFNIWTKTQE